MKKLSMVLFLVLSVLLAANFAGAYQFTDNYDHPNDWNVYQQDDDLIGSNPPYEIYGHDWVTSGGFDELRIYTDWDKGLDGKTSFNAMVGDVFLTHTPWAEDADYGIAIRDHGIDPQGVESSGLLKGDVYTPDSNGFLSSTDYFGTNWASYGDHETVTGDGTALNADVSVSIVTGYGLGNDYIAILFDDAYWAGSGSFQ